MSSCKIKINLRAVKAQVENLIGVPISATDIAGSINISRTRVSQILNKPTLSVSTDTIAKLIDYFYERVDQSGKTIQDLKKILLENLLSIEEDEL